MPTINLNVLKQLCSSVITSLLFSTRYGPLACLLVLTSVVSPAWAAEVAISVNDGVTVSQLDFPDDDLPVLDSSVGVLDINLIRLRAQSGINSGYLNMISDGEWLVRNLPIMPDTDYPYSHLSVEFDIGVTEGTDVSSLLAGLLFSEELYFSMPTVSSTTFSVGNQSNSLGGITEESFGAGSSNSPTQPPQLTGISFGDPTNNRMSFQLDHPNIETAKNQCLPMSVANSLQYLANTTQLELPNSHVMGLKGDQSLVGQLDTLMDRTATSRRSGNPLSVSKGITGKLKYLANNELHERITTRHWGLEGDTDFSASNGDKTATSKAQGTALNFDKMVDALDAGEDCEAGYLYPGGGHAIDLVGAGYIAGRPFMIESSDVEQSSDTEGAGSSGFRFSYLTPRADGFLTMNGSSKYLAFIMCQAYTPAPEPTGTSLPPADTTYSIPGAEVKINKVTDPAGHSCCAEFPPSAVDLVFENGRLVVAGGGSTPWLPMSLTIDSQGNISGSDTANVAGFSNIGVSISGVITGDKIVAEIILGTKGGLPQGEPITFAVDITPDEIWPWLFKAATPVLRPAIRINGFRNSHTLIAGEPLSISVSVQPGTDTAINDWWLVAEAQGVFFSFDAATMNWLPGVAPVLSSPAVSIPAATVFTFEDGLPAGDYNFHFGLDATADGVLNAETLAVDSVVVSINAQ